MPRVVRSVLRRSGLRSLLAPPVAAILRDLGSANLAGDLETLVGRNARTVLDVGAWRGQDSELYARLFPEAQIHAFEPNPATLEILQAKRIERTTVHPVALGNINGLLPLHLRGGLSSLLMMSAEGLRQYGPKDIGQRRVPVRRLDDAVREFGIDHVDLIKIDVQGYELEVIAGAIGTLARTRVVQVECNFVRQYVGSSTFSDVDVRLREQGFRLYNLYDLFRESAHGVLLFGDGLFVRDR